MLTKISRIVILLFLLSGFSSYAEETYEQALESETEETTEGAPAIDDEVLAPETEDSTGVLPVVEDFIQQDEELLDSAKERIQLEELPAEFSEREEEFLNESASQDEDIAQPVADEDAEDARVEADLLSEPFTLLGKTVKPGRMKRLRWIASETLYGSNLDTPVYVIHGSKPGLTVCLTAAIHGDELNGVEIVRQTINNISADQLSGTLIGVPIVNLLGFTRATRYLPDRRDLNRYFPGKPNGSSASRIAYSFFEEIIRRCDRLVDLHTGSLNRTNMPQLRANLQIPEILEFTGKFGSTAVLHSKKLKGNLRAAATNIGVPAVALELGEPGSLQKKHIKEGVKIIQTLLGKLGMIKSRRTRSEPQPVYYRSRWVRVNNGGLLTTEVKVGARIKKGTVLGALVNPLTNERFEVQSPYNGRLLGMALNQFMLPGYAAFNIGLVEEEPGLLTASDNVDCSQIADSDVDSDCNSDEDEELQNLELDLDDSSGVDEAELH